MHCVVGKLFFSLKMKSKSQLHSSTVWYDRSKANCSRTLTSGCSIYWCSTTKQTRIFIGLVVWSTWEGKLRPLSFLLTKESRVGESGSVPALQTPAAWTAAAGWCILLASPHLPRTHSARSESARKNKTKKQSKGNFSISNRSKIHRGGGGQIWRYWPDKSTNWVRRWFKKRLKKAIHANSVNQK